MIKDWVAHWLLVGGHLISSMGCNLSGGHYRERERDHYCYLCRRRLPTNGWYVFFLGIRLDFQGCWQDPPKLARWAEACKLFSMKEVKA